MLMRSYAIIRNQRGTLETIQLGLYEEYEWNHYKTVKELSTRTIKWFDSEQLAIDFMFDNFDRELIDSKYIPSQLSNNCKYYID